MSVNVANQCNSRINYRDVYYKRTGSLLNERKFQEKCFIARDCPLKSLRTWPTSGRVCSIELHNGYFLISEYRAKMKR